MLTTMRLRLHGDELDPEDVTKLLKVAPHFSCRKGDVSHVSLANPILERTSRWEWYSEDESRSVSVDDHIAKLASTFEKVLDKFIDIPGMQNGWIDFSLICVAGGADTQVSITLNSASVATIGKIGMPVEFSSYILSDDSDAKPAALGTLPDIS